MFDGRCEKAFRFYARCTGGTVSSLFTWGGSPMAADAPPGWADKVLHASVTIGDTEITGSDVAAYRTPQGFSVLLAVGEPDEAQRIFDALSENGAIGLPMQQTFWSARYGMLIDQFGVPWEINCQQAPTS